MQMKSNEELDYLKKSQNKTWSKKTQEKKTSKANLINRLNQVEERISSLKDKVDEMNRLKKMLNLKTRSRACRNCDTL